jgi:hypothetical protein
MCVERFLHLAGSCLVFETFLGGKSSREMNDI